MGDAVAWHQIDWTRANANVRRLRQRIFRAEKLGDYKQVRSLQKLMLRSYSNTLVSVRQVSQISAGRKTAGAGGATALTPKQRWELARQSHDMAHPWRARPVRRVYIPKSNGTQRPLGIPTIMDRALQARVKSALEPQWEARFDQRSYGFRPGRCAQDAIQAIWGVANAGNRGAPARQWVLDADLVAAFDRINHEFLLDAIGGFPAKGMVRAWLKAGVMERGTLTPTGEGTPQGGVISPLLLNIALNGMEEAAGCRYRSAGKAGRIAASGTPVLVKYADDFVVLCTQRKKRVKSRPGWEGGSTPKVSLSTRARHRCEN